MTSGPGGQGLGPLALGGAALGTGLPRGPACGCWDTVTCLGVHATVSPAPCGHLAGSTVVWWLPPGLLAARGMACGQTELSAM